MQGQVALPRQAHNPIQPMVYHRLSLPGCPLLPTPQLPQTLSTPRSAGPAVPGTCACPARLSKARHGHQGSTPASATVAIMRTQPSTTKGSQDAASSAPEAMK